MNDDGNVRNGRNVGNVRNAGNIRNVENHFFSKDHIMCGSRWGMSGTSGIAARSGMYGMLRMSGYRQTPIVIYFRNHKLKLI